MPWKQPIRGEHVGAAGDLAGQLQGRLHGVGAGGAGEHDLEVQSPGLEDVGLEELDEFALGFGVHIHGVDDAVSGQVVADLVLDIVVIVAVVQRTCAAEEVNVVVALIVGHDGALGCFEDGGEFAAVGPHFALIGFEYCLFHTIAPTFFK